jgi:hypothetical protein
VSLILNQQHGFNVRPRWSPLDLGDDLCEWWNADDTNRLSISGGAVATWTSVKGLALTGAGAGRAWSATSFNGAPGITFNGTDDVFSATAAQGRIPNTSGFYMFGVVQQDALPADATTRIILNTGTSNGARKYLSRFVVSAVNRVRGGVDTSTTSTGATGDFSGRHMVAARFEAATLSTYFDGAADGSVAAAPVTNSARARIGANQAGTGNFWSGKMRDVMVVRDTISATQLANLSAFLLARRMP